MAYFEYSKSVKNLKYYEILEMFMKRWEFEIVEFKEAKGGYDTDKIGRYSRFAISLQHLKTRNY